MDSIGRSGLWTAGIGFAVFLAMNSFSLWGFSSLPQAAFGGEADRIWSLPMALGNVLSFFAYAIAAALRPRAFDRTPLPEAAAFMSLGIILLIGFLLTKGEAMLLGAGVLYGIGTTCCFICWERIFANGGIEAAKRRIILASLLSALPFLIYLVIRPEAVLLVMLVLALLNLGLIQACDRKQATELPGGGGAMPKGSGSATNGAALKAACKDFLPSLFCLAMIGLVSPMLQGGTPIGGTDPLLRGAFIHGANALSALVLVGVWTGLKRSANLKKSFFVFYPLLITALFAYPFLESEARIGVVFLGTLGFTLFSVVMMVSCIGMAQEKGLTIGFVYPLFAGVLYASHLLGSEAARAMAASGLTQDSQLLTSAFLLLYGCSLVLFLLSHKDREEDGGSTGSGTGMGAHKGVGSGAEMNASVSAGADEPAPDLISERCRILTRRHGFSERQAEVLELLARGYDVPSTAKKLFLSENTVRTHAKKVYAALEVHSKQDIIDLVNSPEWKGAE